MPTFDFLNIMTDRKVFAHLLIIYRQVNNQQEVRLNFICTHIPEEAIYHRFWAQTAAAHFKICENISCYSGGTERTTALFPMVAKTLENLV
jgi:arsenate reductase